MKKIDLAQTISILANVGVIAGIVFLAFELQQNNELLAAQARRDQLMARTAPAQLILTNESIAEVSFKLGNGEDLTPRERERFYQLAYYTFRQWEWQFGEYKAGTLQESELPVNGWKNRMNANPLLQTVWNEWKDNLSSEEFVRFVDEAILSEE